MLRRIHSIRSPSYSSCRRYSTPSPYSDTFKNNKLRAYRFQVPPENALRHIGAWASALNSTTIGSMVNSLASVWFPFLDIKPPIRWSAVYFPAWIVDAEVEGLLKTGSSQHNTTAIIRHTYVPGSDVPLLSAAPLWNSRDDHVIEDMVPFTEDLLHQQGQEVQCIPFSVSPFSLIHIAGSSNPRTSWNITRDLSVSPASIKTKMFSAQPVLLPLYLAQYKMGERPGQTMTLFTSGHQECINVMSQNIRGQNPVFESTFEAIQNLKAGRFIDLESEVLRFLPVDPSNRVHLGAVSLTPATDTAKAIGGWLNDQMKFSNNISKLAEVGQLKCDDDPRIRGRTEDNEDALNKYFNLSSEITMVKRIISTMVDGNMKAKVMTFGNGSLPQFQAAEDASAMLKSKLKELEEERRKAIPQWWIEWELSSNPESKTM